MLPVVDIKKVATLLVLAVAVGFGFDVGHGQAQGREDRKNTASPARKIEHDFSRQRRHYRPREEADVRVVRSIDGGGNNLEDPGMGAAFTPLQRWVGADYADGVSELAGANRPGPREISNEVNAQEGSIPNRLSASDFLWQWGQFLDHDIDLTDGTVPPELANIPVPAGDFYFDPDGTGVAEILFNRSIYDEATGTEPDNPRQQLNEITAWIDASNVYGSEEERASALRTNDGTSQLRTSPGNLLPLNDVGLLNAGGADESLFLAGDVRANEQVGLTALHTLFVREHNRLAGLIAEDHLEMNGDEIYETARRIVGAQMQVITYNEFLPVLLGPDALAPYTGYDPSVNAQIANLFSAAAFRLGHSLLSPTLLRLDADGREIFEGHLARISHQDRGGTGGAWPTG